MSDRAAKLHASPWQGVLHVTGGGSTLLSELLKTPGASATVLEATVPYAASALADLLKQMPEQAASETTARAMSVVAFERAKALSDSPEHLFGLGCTASLATNRRKRGQLRAHWAIHTRDQTYSYTLILEMDGTREAQETKLVDAIFACIGNDLLGETNVLRDNIQRSHAMSPVSMRPVFDTAPYKHCVGEHNGKLLVPGSFNPIHHGHTTLLETAQQITGRAGAFELSVLNADKPPLGHLTIAERLAQFEHPVWLTNTPNFVDKAVLFGGCIFALGTDTMRRIAEPRFYPGGKTGLRRAISQFADLDTRFLVFGRIDGQEFMELDDLKLPDGLLDLCDEVTEEQYRVDISSTELRRD